jgi:hypothetical protein
MGKTMSIFGKSDQNLVVLCPFTAPSRNMPRIHALNMGWRDSCIMSGMNERIEVVPTSEFGSCAVQVERTNSGGVWLYQGDARIYVGSEQLALAILPPNLTYLK